MAISIARTLTLSTKSVSPLSRLLSRRNQSNQPSSDLVDGDASSCNTDPLIRKLEDAIHCIIVRRSAPDWLPFYPGASYWVPPPSTPSNNLANLLHNLTDPLAQQAASSSSLTSPGLWPSPLYFIPGSAPHPTEIEATSNCKSHSEDEEG